MYYSDFSHIIYSTDLGASRKQISVAFLEEHHPFILKLINGGSCPRGCHGREITGFIIRLTSKLTSNEEDDLKGADLQLGETSEPESKTQF
jgi:hypothetical protein